MVMSETREQQNVPKLRFPEFSGAWEKAPLGAISEKITSGSRDWAQFYSTEGDLFIRMTNLRRDERIDLDLSDVKFVSLPKSGHEGARTSLQPDDILISITAELGKIGLVPNGIGNAYINQHTALVRPRRDNANPSYVAQDLARFSNTKRLNRLNDAGAKAGLNLTTISRFKISIPTLREQRKIADFLGAVDARIGQLERKKALLEAYKKGCMQKLFSRKLRFKRDDGTDFPDWEEKRLGDLGDFYGGGTPDTTNEEFWSGKTPWISSSDIEEGKLRHVSITRWVSDSAVKNSATKVVPAGSLLIVSRVGVGKLAIAPVDLCTSQDFLNFVPKFIDNEYLGYWLIENKGKMLSFCQGTSIKGLSYSELKRLFVEVPNTAEQRKIADFLSAIDDKIALVAQELDHARSFKKGLLQQMFV